MREIRAQNRCEWCGIKNYAVGWRDKNGSFHCYSEEMTRYKTAKMVADDLNLNGHRKEKFLVIVLTTAHLFDDRPEASQLLNLVALCQRCHLTHDAKLHAVNRRLNKIAESGQSDLFNG